MNNFNNEFIYQIFFQFIDQSDLKETFINFTICSSIHFSCIFFPDGRLICFLSHCQTSRAVILHFHPIICTTTKKVYLTLLHPSSKRHIIFSKLEGVVLVATAVFRATTDDMFLQRTNCRRKVVDHVEIDVAGSWLAL